MIGDCLNYKIAIQWLSSRPIGVPFARCVTTLGPYRKRDRIKTVPTKSVDALALDRQADSRSMPLKVPLDDRKRFALKCPGMEGKVALRVLIHGNHWPSWRTEAWINRPLLANASNMLTRGKSIQRLYALTRAPRNFPRRKLHRYRRHCSKSSSQFFRRISLSCIRWKRISH